MNFIPLTHHPVTLRTLQVDIPVIKRETQIGNGFFFGGGGLKMITSEYMLNPNLLTHISNTVFFKKIRQGGWVQSTDVVKD